MRKILLTVILTGCAIPAWAQDRNPIVKIGDFERIQREHPSPPITSFYDKKGQYIGRAIQRPGENGTSFYDSKGRFVGRTRDW